VGLVVFGHAPPWLAVVVWLCVLGAGGWLVAAIRDLSAHKRAERDELTDMARRLDDIERYLFTDPPEEDDDEWPNSTSRQ
jgi:hypothetical protein